MVTDPKGFLVEVLGASVDELPTLPDVANQVAQMTMDQNYSPAALAKLISRDPSLAARVLKLANSPVYGARAKIDSIDRAAIVIGSEEVRSIALSIGAFEAIGSARPLRRRMQRSKLWAHSKFVGLAAEALARHEFNLGQGYYVHGLVHDIGKVALDAFRGDEFDQVLDFIAKRRTGWQEAEREVFGTDHVAIGEALLTYWEFPEGLVAAAGGHHDPWEWDGDQESAGLVFVANLVARTLGQVSFDGDKKVKVSTFLTREAGKFLQTKGWKLDRMLVERTAEQVRTMSSMMD